MDLSFYTGLDAFCIILLIVLYVSMLFTGDRSRQYQFFRRILLLVTLLILFDLQWSLCNDGVIDLGVGYCWLINIVYCVIMIFISLSWFVFFNSFQTKIQRSKKYETAALLVSFAVVLFLAFSTYWTGAIFKISDAGVYSRGPLFSLYVLCVFIPLIIVTVDAVYNAIRSELRAERLGYLTFAFFIVPILIMELLQLTWYDFPALCMGLTFSMLITSMNLQNRLITEDQLTGLNNLFSFETYIQAQFKKHRYNATDDLFLVVLDIDAFKLIVENCGGHYNSGKVISMVADILSKASAGTNSFLATHGGNKYIIVYEGTSEGLNTMLDRFDIAIAEKNNELPYVLHLSRGVAQLDTSHVTFANLYDEADMKMKEAKQAYYDKIGYIRQK